LIGHRNGATSIDFSGDGLIATAGKDGSVRIWQMNDVLEGESPEPIQELSAFNQRVTWIEFYQGDRPAAEMLATASKDGSVIIWDRSLEGWGIRRPGNLFKQRYQFDGHQDGAFSTTFLANGQQIAVAQGDGQIKLWHLETSAELMQRACAWLGNIPKSSDRRFPKTPLLWAQKSDPEIADICRKYD
jgi:WD40 repeat protein